jgi:hypothetical protein
LKGFLFFELCAFEVLSASFWKLMSKDMSVTMAVQDRKFKFFLTDKKPSVDIFKKYSMMPQGLYTSWGTPWYNFEVIVTRGKLGLSQPV